VRRPVWNHPRMRGLVAALLLAAVGAGAYWAGARFGSPQPVSGNSELQSSLLQISIAKQVLEKAIQTDNQRIAELEQQTVIDKNDMDKLRAEAQGDAQRAAATTDAMDAAKRDADMELVTVSAERDANANKLRDAEKLYHAVQDELNLVRSQHQQDLMRVSSLEARVNSLSADLDDQNKRSKSDEQFLASDKDIRDLIGARNLYIADIMDVSETGQSRKPFGRVFYTKTKSLIFYAYDLDHQPGMKRASTFQVWGRTSASDHKPVNLGILYMDSETNRRWTLRVDNPDQLANLDSVFVTIEPREQTDRPTGKPFLYASLRREPNHP
jgi:hypothetical protein